MKRYFNLFLGLLLGVVLGACSSNTAEQALRPDWTYSSVVYEMNVRQQTEEGTFAAAEKRLPFLKELGVDIIWLMPIHPIGEKGRKGSLGSYYAIRNYREVNPEFGTMQDFEQFLAAAHSEGFRVILDLVANHTSPDSEWVEGRDASWYHRDSTGQPIVQYDWTDISKLNYENQDLRDEMISMMKFWIEKGVDGFRCDVAGEVPDDFWSRAFSEVRQLNSDVYFLAEGEGVHFHEHGFDATYSWEFLHLMEDVAKGKKPALEIRKWLDGMMAEYPKEAFRLMFTSNHDENSWAGTEFERMGAAYETMAALTYVLPQGQPLIYTGQEIGFDRRFKFFDKDPVLDWTPTKHTAFYKKMNTLRHENPALMAGEQGGEFQYMTGTVDPVLAFTRIKSENQVFSVFNLSNEVQPLLPTVAVEGKWTNCLTGEQVEIKSGEEMSLQPWQYFILTRK